MGLQPPQPLAPDREHVHMTAFGHASPYRGGNRRGPLHCFLFGRRAQIVGAVNPFRMERYLSPGTLGGFSPRFVEDVVREALKESRRVGGGNNHVCASLEDADHRVLRKILG